MGKRDVDWSAATPEQINTSLRVWKLRLTVGAIQYGVVIALAFWLGSPILGAVTVVVALVGLPLTWRWVHAKHRGLRNRAPGAPI
jgi:Flp pilus assembly protein TadB